MLFDLGKFKKVSSDKKSTTLQHPDGHTIQVAHDALSPKMRAKLSKLDSHGVAVKEPKDQAPNEQQDGALAKMGKLADDPASKNFAKGGKVQAFDGGGQMCASPDGTQHKCTPDDYASKADRSGWTNNAPKKDSAPDPGADKKSAGAFQSGFGFADGGDTDVQPAAEAEFSLANPQFPPEMQQPVAQPDARNPMATLFASNDDSQAKQQAQAAAEKMIPGAEAGAAPAPQTANVPRPAATNPADLAPPQQQQAPQGNGAPSGLMQAAQTAIGGVNQEIAGKRAEGTALAQQADAQQQSLDQAVSADQHVQNTYQASLNHLGQVNQDLSDSIANNEIDPKRYINNMSTGQHIASSIGIILGGFGQAFLGLGSNPAVDQLNRNIDRDIDAQKTQLGNKKTLLEANMQQYHNAAVAADVTRMQTLTMTQHQLAQTANKYNNPVIQARATQAIGELQQKKADVQRQAAMTMTLANAQQSGNPEHTIAAMRYLNPEMAKEMESRYVPGVGMASVPVPEQARSQIIAMQDFDKQMKNLTGWAQQHSGEVKAISPTDVNTGRAMAKAAQNSYRTAQAMGVYKESEAPLLEQEIPSDPTQFLNKYRVLPQYKAVLDNNSRKLGTMTNAYGLKAPAGATPIQTTAPKLSK